MLIFLIMLVYNISHKDTKLTLIDTLILFKSLCLSTLVARKGSRQSWLVLRKHYAPAQYKKHNLQSAARISSK